jgi:hypothetical protein
LLCALRELPAKGMLSTATAKDKNIHLKVLAKIGKGRGLRVVFAARSNGTVQNSLARACLRFFKNGKVALACKNVYPKTGSKTDKVGCLRITKFVLSTHA